MGLFHSIIYQPAINTLLRNINKLLSPILPKKFKIHPSGLLKVKIDSNLSFYLKTNQTSYLTRELFWKKPLEFEYTSIFIDLVKKVGSFWDIGANIGYYSILGCKANPNLKVIAFEPSVGPKVYMTENLKINGLEDRITIEPMALSNFNGEIEFYQIVNPKFPSILNLSGEHNMGTKKSLTSEKVKIPSLRIDDYESSANSIDLIKIDTEGAEVEILKGGQQTILKHRPIIVCETLFNRNEVEIEQVLGGLGYRFFNHTENGLQEAETLMREVDNGVRNCFCVPDSKLDMIKEYLTNEG